MLTCTIDLARAVACVTEKWESSTKKRFLKFRYTALCALLVLSLMIWWPIGWMRKVSYPRRIQLVVGALVSLIIMALMKRISVTSCPWDLQAFGGPAHYVSHWSLGTIDGGSGRCFPGGHASSAYAFVALCLPWLMPPAGQQRARAPGWRWLGVLLFAGLVAGAVQTVRGAHYPSHTLWTLIICAGVSLAGWSLARRGWQRPA